jgi:hypothetical protein
LENVHQSLDTLAVDLIGKVPPQHHQHPPAAVERILGVELVQAPQQQQILLAFEDGCVVVGRARQPRQSALPRDAQLRMIGLDPFPAFLNRAVQIFLEPVEFDFQLTDFAI